MQVILAVLTLTFAFAIGYAIRSGSICAVAATRAWIVDGKTTRIKAFGVCAAMVAVLVPPLGWWRPDMVDLSPAYPLGWTVVMAGVVFGIGARINDACALGTLSHLTAGRMAYAFSVFFAMIGAVASTFWEPRVPAPLSSPMERPTLFSMGAVVLAALMVALAVRVHARRWWREYRRSSSARLGPYRAMLVIGLCGGLLYATAGEWTYMSVLSQRAARLIEPSASPLGWTVWMAALVLIAGGITASVRSRTFSLRVPNRTQAVRCSIGGLFMGASASVIPGGNGALLLHGVPSAATHAVAAYAAMTFALSCLFLHRRNGRTGSS